MKDIFFLIITSLLLSCCNSPNQKELKLNLSTSTYTIHISRETSKKFRNHLTADTLNMVISLHAPTKKITFLDINAKSPKRFVRINDQVEEQFDINTLLTAAKGLSVHAVINEKGITEKIENINELFTAIAARTGEPIGIIRSRLADYLSEDAIKDNLNRLFSTVPLKKVTPGQNWASTITLTAKAPVNINSLYTFRNRHADSAFINIHSTILAGSYLTGQQNGTVILNYKTGVPYKYETLGRTITKTTAYDVQEIEHFLATFVEN